MSDADQDTLLVAQPPPQGFPLGSLFVIVAACAVLAVAIAPLVRELGQGEIDVELLIATLVGGGIVFGLLGLVMGWCLLGRFLGGVLGAPIGMFLGVVAGLIVHTPGEALPRVALAMLVGSVCVVLLAFWMRKRQ